MMLIEHSGNVRCLGTRWQVKAIWTMMILFGIVSIARVHGQETLTLQGPHPRLRFDDNAGTTQAWSILGDNVSLDVINETAGTTPFRVDPLAFQNSLVVGAYGQIGFGTYIPSVELHVSTNHFSPTLRLETTGVVPHAWDLQGTASGFSIVDVTNANTRPFSILAGAPTDSFLVDTTGMIGLGTSTPAARLHARVPAVAGVESIVKFDITDDAIGKLEINNASATNGVFHPRFRGTTNAQAVGLTFEGAITDDIGANPVVSFAASKIVGGSVTNRPLLVVRNNQTVRVRVAANGDMFATSFSPTSSRALKDNIVDLDSQKASKALQQLTPVEYVYKDDSSAEGRVGFIAEDVPELVANADRKSVPIMDVLALVTRVVKDQQQTIDEQKKVIDEQTKFISEQRSSNDEQKRLNDQLAKRLEDLEKRFQGK